MNRNETRSLCFGRLIAFTMTVALSAVPPLFGKSAEADKPNIVYILCDDLGYGEVQVYNPTRGKIPTPNVNDLARQGMMFTDAHAGAAVCTPTRYGVLTGRYAWRSRLQRGVIGPNGAKPLIDEDRLTVGEMLQGEGYATACIGKWHLGFRYSEKRENAPSRTSRAPVGAEVINGPTTRGFDYFYGFPLSRTMRTVIENGEVVEELPVVKMLPRLADRASQYIRKKAEGEKPFFLYLALNSPHSPVVPNEQFKGRTGLNDWADYVMETDWAVGKVLKTLRETGLKEETLVIFTSDNGSSPNASNVEELERQGHYPSGPLRGYKTDVWDGGHREPFIVRWPGIVEPGTINDRLVCLTDLMATCADLLDRELPESAAVDSVSILPLLKGGDEPVRRSMVHHSGKGRFAIRKGEWKLNLCAGSGGWGSPSDKQARQNGLPQVQLYHMGRDIREQDNLRAEKPEVVATLVDLLQKQVLRGRSTPGPSQPNDVKVDIWKKARTAKKRLAEQ